MIEETAQVIALDRNIALLQTQRKSACQACSAKSGCGTSVLSNVMGKRFTQLRVNNSLGARVGDEVMIGVAEHALVQVSLLMYLVPLVMLLAGALGSEALSNFFGLDQSVMSILGGLGGFLISLSVVRKILNHAGLAKGMQPIMLRIIRSSWDRQ